MYILGQLKNNFTFLVKELICFFGIFHTLKQHIVCVIFFLGSHAQKDKFCHHFLLRRLQNFSVLSQNHIPYGIVGLRDL